MMKLTVAFLGALAAADAAEARSHRQARRQYYGGGYPHNGGNTAVSSVKPIETPKPVETPKVSATPSVPYVQSSADNFKPSIPAIPSFGASSSAAVPVSSVVVDGSSVPAVPVASSKPVDYGNGYGTTPASSSAKVPSNGVASSSAVVPSGVVPSKGVPSGVVPSSGAFSASSVAAVSSKVPSNSGVYPPAGGVGASGSVVPVYPTGTGSKPSATPVTDLVTKTIYSTQIYQISSKLVSTVVPVGTTVCPKDEASPTPAASVTPEKVYTSEVPISEITKKVTETLVYTVGVGSTAHPVTTEVVSTSTSTIYKTVVITLAKPTPTPGQGYPVGSNGSKPVDEETSTKTIKSTSTTTKYITVKPTPSGKVPVGAEGSPVPGGPAGGENCAVPVTVTVTAQETVYVTKGQDNSKPTPAPGKPSAPVPSKPEGTPVKPSGGAGVPTKPSAAPSGHYPYQNGTHPYPAGPTGFQTSAKPSVPVGTGGVPVPSKATSSLPAFSFVSEPVKTPSQETGVPVPSATPASASAPPAGGNYGNGYGASSAAPSSKVVVETPTPAVSTPAVPSSKVPSNEQSTPAAKPTPTPVGNGGYGNGYGTY